VNLERVSVDGLDGGVAVLGKQGGDQAGCHVPIEELRVEVPGPDNQARNVVPA